MKADPCLRVRLLPSLGNIRLGAKLIYRVTPDGPPSHDRVLIPKICEICGIDYNTYVKHDKEKGHSNIDHSQFNVTQSFMIDLGKKGWPSYCICNQKHKLIRFCSFVTSDEKFYYFQIGGTCHSYITGGMMDVHYCNITDRRTKRVLKEFMVEELKSRKI